MKCFICNEYMQLQREKDISRYNDLFDLKLSFSCPECGAVVNAYPPKDDLLDEAIRRSGEYHG
tara:strand:+ start:345 stop:533 length:189 start_codon:yes stop_codon:yes gene_type:complete